MKKLFLLAVLLFPVLAFCQAPGNSIVSPNWDETWKYANMSGQQIWTIVGVGLIVLAVWQFWRLKQNKLPGSIADKPSAFIARCVLFVVLGLASILGKPIAIHISNDKEVNTEYLNKVGRAHILDSCFNNTLLINASNK